VRGVMIMWMTIRADPPDRCVCCALPSAMNLKTLGKYMSRTLSFADTTFTIVRTDLDDGVRERGGGSQGAGSEAGTDVMRWLGG
jgi:Ni,Fe-hydrogenase III large subunit